MAFTFTQVEKEELVKLRDIARADKIAGISGSYAKAYLYLANRLNYKEPEAFLPPHDWTSPADRDPEVKKVALWLEGAAQANAGIGIFSKLIRDFSIRQGALRYANYAQTVIPNMQDASDQVSENAIRGILESGVLPSLAGIAKEDAAGVGRILFDRDSSDTAHPDNQNSAWAGTILFSMLGGDETGRLLGGPVDEEFNTLNDLRDLIFAYESLIYAYNQNHPLNSTQAARFGVKARLRMLIDWRVNSAFSMSFAWSRTHLRRLQWAVALWWGTLSPVSAY